MNERIKELATYCIKNSYETRINIEDFERFAELIIKECAELTLDYKNEQHYWGWLDYRDAIKEHFGVE
jgi:hypothetical protein